MTPRSYHSDARQAATAETRARIVRAARELLVESVTFSMEQVAKRAKVTRVTVYHQFESKVRLLDAVFDAIADEGGLMTALPRAFQSRDPRAALRDVIHAFCDFWRDNRVILSCLEASIPDEEVAASLHERTERRRTVMRTLVKSLTDGKESNELADLLFSLTGFPMWSSLALPGRKPAAVERIIQTAVDAVVDRFLRPKP